MEIEKYHKSILDMIRVAKTLGFKTKIIEEAPKKHSLYIFKKKNSFEKFFRVPLQITDSSELVYYEQARIALEKIKLVKDKKDILKNIKSSIRGTKKDAEAKFVSTLSFDEFNIYFDWASKKKKK